ncbi:hypothetical protein N0V88_000021 [Collariella sp. IMI 366227]|nr:hypothetical protein N0V88_000021 [Collariella sp. IMI 366227]
MGNNALFSSSVTELLNGMRSQLQSAYHQASPSVSFLAGVEAVQPGALEGFGDGEALAVGGLQAGGCEGAWEGNEEAEEAKRERRIRRRRCAGW